MQDVKSVTAHYVHGDLLERLKAALLDDGVDPSNPTIEALARYDHFHGRGIEATEELAGALDISAGDHLLDIGSGIGGPARYLAHRFGCQITGVDLTAEFCEAAREITKLVGLEEQIGFEQGNALDMPFESGHFDGAYSMNVSMNIADKRSLYAEIHRVLRPGGWLALSELSLGPAGEPDYPTPWAESKASSFLVTLEETLEGLESSGFTVMRCRDTLEETFSFFARSKAMVDRGEKPPQQAATLMHGDLAADIVRNVSTGVKERRLVPIEVFCRKSEGG